MLSDKNANAVAAPTAHDENMLAAVYVEVIHESLTGNGGI